MLCAIDVVLYVGVLCVLYVSFSVYVLIVVCLCVLCVLCLFSVLCCVRWMCRVLNVRCVVLCGLLCVMWESCML